MNRRFKFLLLSSLGLLILIFTDWVPWLRGPAPGTSEWYWPYLLRPYTRWGFPLAAALFFLIFAWRWLLLSPTSRTRHFLLLTILTASSAAIQISLIYADRPDILAELVNRTLTNLDGGYFLTANEITDLSATLQTYPEAMLNFPSEHARTHPPGLIIANHLTPQLLETFPSLSLWLAKEVYPGRCTDLWLLPRPFSVAGALLIWALLPIIAAAITIWPADVLARAWLPPPAARTAVVLIATIPSLLLFAPKVVQFYPALVLVLFWLLHRGISGNHSGWLFTAGLGYSILTFLSLGNLVLALPIGLYILLWLAQNGRFQPKIILQTTIPLILGGITTWTIYWIGYGVPPWAIIQTGLNQHYELVTRFRQYDWWIMWNLIDVIIYLGWPTVVGFCLSVTTSVRAARHHTLTPANIMTLSLLTLLLLLNFSGTARGEVGRIWIFFFPLLALVAAPALTNQFPSPKQRYLVIAAQLAITIAIGLAWQPVRPVIVVANPPDIPAVTMQQETAVSFTETIAYPISIYLDGYTLSESTFVPGDTLTLTLFWHSDRPTIRPYTVFTQLLDNHNTLITQQDNWPMLGQWPSTCWTGGIPITDPYSLTIPPDTPSGQYRLIIGLYDAASGTRLPTNTGTNFIELAPVLIR